MNQNRPHSNQQRKLSGRSMTFVKHQNAQKSYVKISGLLSRCTAVLPWLNNIRWFLKGTIDLLYISFQRNSKSLPVSKARSIDYARCRAPGFLCDKRSRPQERPWIQPPAQRWRAFGSSLSGKQGCNFSGVGQVFSNSLLYHISFLASSQLPSKIVRW